MPRFEIPASHYLFQELLHPIICQCADQALMALIRTRPVATHDPGIIVFAYVCEDATNEQMAMLTDATDRCAEQTFRQFIAAFRTRTGDLDGDVMYLLLPQTTHTGHLAYEAYSDKLLGGQKASTLFTRAIGEPRFINTMAAMAFSAEQSGEPHFDNVGRLLDAVVSSIRSSLPTSTRELPKQRGGYSTVLFKPAKNEEKVLLAAVDAKRKNCRRMSDARKSIEDANGTGGTACVLVVAGTEDLRVHMERRLPTPAAAMPAAQPPALPQAPALAVAPPAALPAAQPRLPPSAAAVQPALALALMQIIAAAQLVAAQQAAQPRLPPPAAAMPAAHPPVPAPAAPIIQLLVPAPPPAAALLAALLAAHPPAAAQPAPGAGNRFSHLPINALKRKFAAVSVARAALNEQGGAEEPTVRRGVRPSVEQVVLSDDDDDSASETE